LRKEITKFNTLTTTKKVFSIINYCLSIGFALTSIGFLIDLLVNGDPNNRMVACIATCFCYLLPLLFQLIFRIRISPILYFVYLLFITFAAFFGSVLMMNSKISYIDKLQHFIWGYIACIIGLFFLCRTREIDIVKPITIFVMFFAISMATATIWEIIEFLGGIWFNQTAQGVPVNGVVPVTDSMYDMICHLCGSVLFSLHFILDRVTHKNLGISGMINDFKIDY